MGTCVTAQDCAGLSDACNIGTCVNGGCEKTPANEAMGCDDGKNCTDNDTCQGGLCKGPLKFCPSPDSCHLGLCDTDTDSCISVPGNDGAPCNDTTPARTAALQRRGVPCRALPSTALSSTGSARSASATRRWAASCKPKNDGAPCNDSLYCTIERRLPGRGVRRAAQHLRGARGHLQDRGVQRGAEDLRGRARQRWFDLQRSERLHHRGDLRGGALPGRRARRAGGHALRRSRRLHDGGHLRRRRELRSAARPSSQCVSGDGCCPGAARSTTTPTASLPAAATTSTPSRPRTTASRA
jgi:hypothetical protein